MPNHLNRFWRRLPRAVLGLVFGLMALPAWPAEWMTFDELPATYSNAVPGSSAAWLYTTKELHSNANYGMTKYDSCGWRNTNAYPMPFTNSFNYFYLYPATDNNTHKGFETYGYLEVDAGNVVAGHSLKFVVTGGKNTYATNGTTYLQTNGLRVAAKAHYAHWVGAGSDPVAWGARVGHPYVYFMNLGTNPMPEAAGANRLDFYYYAPAALTNGRGGWGNRPEPTVNVGPFNNLGGHWYHEICTQGGGWTHVLCDGHPQHNNAWGSPTNYPYPSSSLRSYGLAYFADLYRWYVTFKPYSGICRAPFAIWFDEIRFGYDPEPQNDETICSPSIVYFTSNQTFEIGFMDKYKNFAYSYSTYELRYAFEPILNATWSNATPAHILPDARFSISNHWGGIFQKFWPYYQSVWAPFTLATTQDLARLQPGTNIYFAVKDISQVGGASQQPVTNFGAGRWPIGGRDYTAYGANFDYAGDQPALPLIKRMDYRIPAGSPDMDGDGLEDWWEQFNFGDPGACDPGADPDGDNLSNLAEATEKSNPNARDTDHDQFDDRQELIAGTDFGNPARFLCLQAIGTVSNTVMLSWYGVTQRFYCVYARTNLMAADLTTNAWQWPGKNAPASCPDGAAAPETTYFITAAYPGFPW